NMMMYRQQQQQQQQQHSLYNDDDDQNHIAEELDTWHGPIPAVVHGGESNMMDDDDAPGGMYYYYVNSIDGITSWEDPRVDAQLIHAIQVKVIQHIAHIFNIQQQQQHPTTAAMAYDDTYDDNATDSSMIIPGDLAAADDYDYDTPDFGSINDDDDDAAAEILNLDDERCGNMTAPHDDDEEEEGVYYNNDGAIVPLHDDAVNYTYGDTVDITRDDGGDGILMRGRSGARVSTDDNNMSTVKRSNSIGTYNNKRSGSSLIRDTTVGVVLPQHHQQQKQQQCYSLSSSLYPSDVS
ncbi:hypothetical protein FOZ61_001113, partial [Perkinsus olseni]